MSFSIKTTIRGLLAPKHRISCPQHLWVSLLQELDRRGERSHEAGAFLLGTITNGRAQVREVVFYDDLDSAAYDTGVCVLDGEVFGSLWALCRERALSVVADVHTHPGRAGQSPTDRTNPMIARSGHIAIIIPYYAVPARQTEPIGVYLYEGSHEWTEYQGKRAHHILYVGRWS
jgi:proteasome lid subunit RPN8/RPN11